MSLYGSVLWDFSSSYVNVFNTEWRKCIRRLYVLPIRTHNALLPGICCDIPPEGQLHIRFLNFMINNLESNNACINLSTTLSINGSNTSTGKSVNYIYSKYHINKYSLMMYSCSRYRSIVHDLYSHSVDENAVLPCAIYDLLIIRDHIADSQFTYNEVQTMIEDLCIV